MTCMLLHTSRMKYYLTAVICFTCILVCLDIIFVHGYFLSYLHFGRRTDVLAASPESCFLRKRQHAAVTQSTFLGTPLNNLRDCAVPSGKVRPTDDPRTSRITEAGGPRPKKLLPGERSRRRESVKSTENLTAHVLCHRCRGRLGNWLFHYASSLALAKRLNAHLVMLKCRRLNRTLESTITNDPDLEQQCADAEYVDARFCCVFYPALFDLPPNRSYVIDGYLQSWRYFSWCDAEVRKALTFKEKIVAKATSVVQTLRNASRGSVLVGVHVRRGDYLKEHMSEVGRKAAPANYFHRAMAYFQEKCGKRNKERRPGQSLQSAEAEFGREGELGKSRGSEVEFVVACADDAGNWCETNLLNKTAAVSILPPNSPAVDMLVLSMLDHVIISVGTFSWWVGYLSRGTVVYYKDFVEAGSRFGKEFGSNLSDYMPPSWIPIS